MADSAFERDAVLTTTGYRPVDELTEENLAKWFRWLPWGIFAHERYLVCGEMAERMWHTLFERGVFAGLFTVMWDGEIPDDHFEIAVMR